MRKHCQDKVLTPPELRDREFSLDISQVGGILLASFFYFFKYEKIKNSVFLPIRFYTLGNASDQSINDIRASSRTPRSDPRET